MQQNVFVDIIIYTFPIYPLWQLQATRSKRIGLIAIMTFGGCTIIVSGLRIIVLWQLATRVDFTYIFGRVVIVTTIEFVTAIVTANMPAMKTIWKYHVSHTMHSQRLEHELRHYNTGSGGITRKSTNRNVQAQSWDRARRTKQSADVSDVRSSSPTESEAELVKGKPVNVIVTSQWEVKSDMRSVQGRAHDGDV